MGVIPPAEGFLEGLRKVTEENGALLIFDEVMTGFRAHLNGAQALYNIVPDLTTFGKVIGGGLPVGAYGGKKEIMQLVAPVGPMYQAGTLSGNPLAMMAGITTLGELKKDGVWQKLENAAASLGSGLKRAADAAGIPIQQTRVGTMFSTFFSEAKPTDWSSVSKSDTVRFGKFFTSMLENGVYIAPSQFEAGFVSTMHTPDVIEATVAAAEKAMMTL
jgi:glutamate-1-semialdehyde 2,1-aminomutase